MQVISFYWVLSIRNQMSFHSQRRRYWKRFVWRRFTRRQTLRRIKNKVCLGWILGISRFWVKYPHIWPPHTQSLNPRNPLNPHNPLNYLSATHSIHPTGHRNPFQETQIQIPIQNLTLQNSKQNLTVTWWKTTNHPQMDQKVDYPEHWKVV